MFLNDGIIVKINDSPFCWWSPRTPSRTPGLDFEKHCYSVNYSTNHHNIRCYTKKNMYTKCFFNTNVSCWMSDCKLNLTKMAGCISIVLVLIFLVVQCLSGAASPPPAICFNSSSFVELLNFFLCFLYVTSPANSNQPYFVHVVWFEHLILSLWTHRKSV